MLKFIALFKRIHYTFANYFKHNIGGCLCFMDIDEVDSYDDIKPFWLQLNQSYKDGELAVDWDIHQQIWKQFFKPKGFSLKILVGFEKKQVIGIFPFKHPNHSGIIDKSWSLGEDAIIAREYFSPPDKIHQFYSYLPDHIATDMSCFYLPVMTTNFHQMPGAIIDLMSSQTAFYQSLNKKKRYQLTKIYQQNSDVTVKIFYTIQEEEISELLDKYIHYWVIKSALNGTSSEVDSHEKIVIDFYLLRRAQEMGKLIALHFYIKNQLVAVNYSVKRESNRVDDYICLRDTDEAYLHRGLGIFAILKNIEFCRENGVRYYDLSDLISDYKRKFINISRYYFTFSKNPDQPSEEVGLVSTDEKISF
jgi:hypothetical protein